MSSGVSQPPKRTIGLGCIREKENSPAHFPAPHTLDPRFPATDVPNKKNDPAIWETETYTPGVSVILNVWSWGITKRSMCIVSIKRLSDETHDGGETLAT